MDGWIVTEGETLSDMKQIAHATVKRSQCVFFFLLENVLHLLWGPTLSINLMDIYIPHICTHKIVSPPLTMTHKPVLSSPSVVFPEQRVKHLLSGVTSAERRYVRLLMQEAAVMSPEEQGYWFNGTMIGVNWTLLQHTDICWK